MPIPQDPAGREAYELDRAHVFHSWSAQKALDPLVITGGEGSYLWDADGKRYLDFSSQLVFTNIGHQHPKVVKAIQDQAATLATIAPAHANDKRAKAAKLITDLTPEGMDKVFFTNGGADAIENAIRMARLHTGRTKVMSAYRSYHGATATAIQVTGDPRRFPNEFVPAGTVHFFGPFLYRSPFHATTEQEECDRALEHLEQMIAFEGPGTIAAIVLETVPGTSGIMPPPPGYLAGVRELCDRFGIMMICDEVMAGFGRTGAWFAHQLHGVQPDVMTLAKGLGGGFPIGAVVAFGERAGSLLAKGDHGTTFGGNPLASAAALATVTAIEDEGLIANAKAIGEHLRGSLEAVPGVVEVRGDGLMLGIGLAAPASVALTRAALDAGFIVNPPSPDTVRLVPALTLSRPEADLFISWMSEHGSHIVMEGLS